MSRGDSAKLKRSFSQWLSLKIASRAPRKASFTLSQRNIYIFPTRAGFSFLVMLGLMLLTAVNYQSSMVYLMTFVLGSVFFVSIWLCFFNLLGLLVEADISDGSFAGELVVYRVSISHPNKDLYGLTVSAEPGFKTGASVTAGQASRLVLSASPQSRGIAKLDRLGLRTTFPFGLIQGWTWLALDCKAPVFPKPLELTEELNGEGDGEQIVSRSDSSSPDLLRPYKEGDNLSRVHWKKYAATGQLVVREQEAGSKQGAWLKWQDYEQFGVELGLSYMCQSLLEGFAKGEAVGIELPKVVLMPSSGSAHRQKCLEALASF